MILLGWCYSNNGDVCRLFRRHAIFSKMILNHDLRTITRNPLAKLNEQQRELLEKNGKDRLLETSPYGFGKLGLVV